MGSGFTLVSRWFHVLAKTTLDKETEKSLTY